jgi:hypothetical protein
MLFEFPGDIFRFGTAHVLEETSDQNARRQVSQGGWHENKAQEYGLEGCRMPEFYRPPVQLALLLIGTAALMNPAFLATTFASETNNGAAIIVLGFNFRQARLKHWKAEKEAG